VIGFLDHNPIPTRNVGKAVEKQLDAVPPEVPFYGRMVEDLRSGATADDKGISTTFLDRVSERYRNRFDTSSRGSKTHTQTQTHEHTHEHKHKTDDGSPPEDPGALNAFNAWNETAARHPRWPKAQNLSSSRRSALH